MIDSGDARFLCSVAQRQRPNMQLVKDSVRSQLNREEYHGDLRGMVAEAYVRMQFSRAIKTISMPTEMIEIPDGFQTDNYLFLQKNGVSTVHELVETEDGKRKGISVTDLDGLAAVGPKFHPFLIEVKMEKYGFCDEDWFGSTLTELIYRPCHCKGIRPVLEYFECLHREGFLDEAPKEIGLILVVPPESYCWKTGSVQRNFERKGGIIMQFPFSINQYSQMIYGLLDGRNGSKHVLQ